MRLLPSNPNQSTRRPRFPATVPLAWTGLSLRELLDKPQNEPQNDPKATQQSQKTQMLTLGDLLEEAGSMAVLELAEGFLERRVDFDGRHERADGI